MYTLCCLDPAWAPCLTFCHGGEAGRVSQCCRPSNVLHIKECMVQRKHTAMKDRAITAWSGQHLFPPAQLLRAFFPDLANRSGSLRREGVEWRRSRWRRWWDVDGGRGPSPDLCSWTVYNFGFNQQAQSQSVFLRSLGCCRNEKGKKIWEKL